MKASKKILVGVLTLGSIGLAATSAMACHGGSGYGYSSYYYPQYVPRAYISEVAVAAPAFAPAHSLIAIMPGDSWFSICTREYGNSSVWSKIADFNGIPQSAPLKAGMQLRLPVINPNGSFSLSSAPAAFAMPPQGFAGGMPQGQPQGLPQGMPQGFAGGMPQSLPQGAPSVPAYGATMASSRPVSQNVSPTGAVQFGGQITCPVTDQKLGSMGPPVAVNVKGKTIYVCCQGCVETVQSDPDKYIAKVMRERTSFAPQGQGFAAQQLPPGLPQGTQFGPQGGLPQMNGSVQQIQALPPQQPQPGLPQGMQPGPQMQQLPPQGPMASQGPDEGPKNMDSTAQRIADQVTGLSDLLSSRPAAPKAGPADRPLPSILIGSLMTINGQQLGDNRGTVRLIVNGSPVPLEIVEWSANGAKVRIPDNLPAGIQAQIEILRADGSVVAKDPVQLAAGQKMAAAN